MTELIFTVIIPGLILSFGFFIIEFLNEKYFYHYLGGKTNDIHASLVAGVSVSYVFLILLPEIVFSLHDPLLEIFPFAFILIGFSFIHLSEKLILQRVDLKTQIRLREILKKEEILDTVEESMEDLLMKELKKQQTDIAALKCIVEVVEGLDKKEFELKAEEKKLFSVVKEHLGEDLDALHIATNYFYHILIGLILFELLTVDFIYALLFYIVAFMKMTISNPSNRHVKFLIFEFHTKFEGTTLQKIIITSSAVVGFVLGCILDLFFPLSLEIIYILLAFIAGVVLYTTVREVIPEGERGRPFYFFIALIISIIAFLLIDFLKG